MKAVLIDIDGVLRTGEELLPGALGFLNLIQEKNIPACLLSNSTKFSAKAVKQFFESNNFELKIPAVTAVDVTASLLKQRYKTASVYCVPSAKRDLSVLPDSDNPEVVVVGDLMDGWTYPILNEVFNKVHNGAHLLAMQKNKLGKNEKGLYLDAGAFIKGIEYASNVEAELVGKPSANYFKIAINNSGSSQTENFIMIGDDLSVDIAPVKELGGTSILMLSGKTNEQMLRKSNIAPDYTFNDLSDLGPKFLDIWMS